MSYFFIPTKRPEDWKPLLAEPDKNWRTGYSAKAIAYCWQNADGFPSEIRKVFRGSGIPIFKNIEMLMAFPEYRVPLPGEKKDSQIDIFVLAKGNEQLISVSVEGKSDEPFGEVISEWKLEESSGKVERLTYLCDQLMLNKELVDSIHYQLLQKMASVVIEAKKFNASNALMLIHAFQKTREKYTENFQAYCRFLKLFGKQGKGNAIVLLKTLNSIDLYAGWVKGNKKYLEA